MVKLLLSILLVFAISGCNKPYRWSFFEHKNQSSSGKQEKIDESVFSGTGDEVKYDNNFSQISGKKGENKADTYPIITGLATKNNDNKTTKDDSEVEQMVNVAFGNSQASALSKKDGQVDLNVGWNKNISYNKDNKNKKNKLAGDGYGVKYNYDKEIERLDREIDEIKKNSQNLNNSDNKQKNGKVVKKKSYKIQCGYYADERQAQKIADKLREAGVDNVEVITENDFSKILAGDFVEKDYSNTIWQKIENAGVSDAFFVYR